MNEKLKPCPFCHKMPKITNNMDYFSGGRNDYHYKISCSCIYDDYISAQANNLEYTIKCWNDFVKKLSEVTEDDI